LSEEKMPHAIEKSDSGVKQKEDLEQAELRPRQVRYQAAVRPGILLS
jgi:hypothetical protein